MTIAPYRDRLIQHGFSETQRLPCHFYKEQMPYTALGINLQEEDGHIRVVYGCGSTAFTKFAGTENALIKRGFWDDCDITIRNGLLITHPDDEPSAEAKIRAYLSQFDGVEKDALLSLTKECRKGFIRQVALKMKPLGFKKKGLKWTDTFPTGQTLSLYLTSVDIISKNS